MPKNQSIQKQGNKPMSPAEEFRAKQRRFIDVVRNKRDQIKMALPQQMQSQQGIDRFLRVCLTALNTTPKLFDCTMASVLAAMVKSAQLGLEPDGTLGQAYLVPFGNQCQFIPGYRGLITLAQRTNRIQRVYAHVVFAADEFDFELGLNERLIHKPSMARYSAEGFQNAKAFEALSDERASEFTPVCAYGVVVYKDGERRFEVVPADRMEKIRQASRGSDHPDSPWNRWTEEMWRKTAVKQVLRFEPLSPDDQAAAALGEAARSDGVVFGDTSLTEDGKVAPVVGSDSSQWTEAVVDTPRSAMDEFVAKQNAQKPAKAPAEQAPQPRARRRRRSAAGSGEGSTPDNTASQTQEGTSQNAPAADAASSQTDTAKAQSSEEPATGQQPSDAQGKEKSEQTPRATRPKRQPNLPGVQ